MTENYEETSRTEKSTTIVNTTTLEQSDNNKNTNKRKFTILFVLTGLLLITAIVIGTKFFTNYLNDKHAAENVIALISEIPNNTNDELAWSEPRKAYDALTDTQKAMVSNLSILEDAEKEYQHKTNMLLVGGDISLLYTYMSTATNNFLNGNSSYILFMEKAIEVNKDLNSRDIPPELQETYELCKDTYTNFSMMLIVKPEARQEYATKFADNMLLLKDKIDHINNLGYFNDTKQ